MYFHRFYIRETFQTQDWYEVALACLFLAGKVEETPKKLKDIVSHGHALHHKTKPLTEDSSEFRKLFERIIVMERQLLHVICFDLVIETPYKHVMNLGKSVGGRWLCTAKSPVS